MKDPRKGADRLVELFNELVNKPMIPTPPDRNWKSWPHHFSDKQSLYVLWQDKTDRANNTRAVYVGKGNLGVRVWNSFWSRPSWKYIQYLDSDDFLPRNDPNGWFIKLFERFCIYVLDPEENKD